MTWIAIHDCRSRQFMTIKIPHRQHVRIYELVGNDWVAVPGNVLRGLFNVETISALSWDGSVVTRG
ncbi:MAG: hypothetical protein PHV74_07450 [Dehalococcoidia bacterium]|nr:hypothetical protein [Dehalococcoidia bacterium]